MITRQTSVIICTHNRADMLRRVIGQLRAQDYPPDALEIIVVNNCCTGHTGQIVGRLIAEPGPPIHHVIENRPGITFARNRGAEAAHYPYLAYLDDDCSVQLDWLSQLMSGFDLDESVVLVAGRILLDFEKQKKPAWLGSKVERWLGAYNFPPFHARLLEFPLYVCEGNMALRRDTWQSTGGFLGMDQFGSPHVAAQEIIVLLKQIERQGGRVAFVPHAIAHHHPSTPTRRLMLRRAFLHGMSDGFLEHILYRRPWASVACHTILDAAAMIAFFGLSTLSFLTRDLASTMYHLLRAIARLGKILSEMHLIGDWARVQSWTSEHSPS